MADERFIKITLVRSPIGYRKYQRVTAETLGLRKLHATVVHRETPAIRGMVNQIGHLLKVEEVDAPAETAATSTSKPVKQPRQAKTTRQVEMETPAAPAAEKTETKAPAKSSRKSAGGDDLTKIEGIGPKMSAALVAAGIDTFAKLADATEAQIRSAIEEAGMRLAPGLESWAEQAGFAAKGDWDGLEQLQGRLVGGRHVD
jgi:large subunit ribosomal protein L21